MLENQKLKFKRQAGTSLIEVVICMFILGVLLVFYTAALNTVAESRKLRNENFAYHVANQQMEDLRATAFASLPASGTITNSLLSQIPSGAGSFTVTNYPSYSGMKEIVVTVTWNDGLARQIVLKTLAGNGGINP